MEDGLPRRIEEEDWSINSPLAKIYKELVNLQIKVLEERSREWAFQIEVRRLFGDIEIVVYAYNYKAKGSVSANFCADSSEDTLEERLKDLKYCIEHKNSGNMGLKMALLFCRLKTPQNLIYVIE